MLSRKDSFIEGEGLIAVIAVKKVKEVLARLRVAAQVALKNLSVGLV